MRKRTTTITIKRTAIAAAFALLLAACGLALAGSPEAAPDSTTTAPQSSTSNAPESVTSTSEPTMTDSGVVSVPDLSGLTLADAATLLAAAGLDVVALPADIATATVVAQEPAPGAEVDRGTAVTVDVQVHPTCNPPDPVAPGAGQTIISVPFECGSDAVAPTQGVGVPRIVPDHGGAVADRIEWTLRSLLAGPTDDERAVGVVSAFDAATADALNSLTLTDGYVVVDFNDAIVVNNMSTSTGSVFFNAELRRAVFHQPEVDRVEFRFDGDCEAWSALFESDGCWVVSRADWERDLAEWDQLRNQ